MSLAMHPKARYSAVTDFSELFARSTPTARLCATLRCSDLIGLDVGDLKFVPGSMVLTVPRSKTDKDGERVAKGISLGPAPRPALRAVQT